MGMRKIIVCFPDIAACTWQARDSQTSHIRHLARGYGRRRGCCILAQGPAMHKQRLEELIVMHVHGMALTWHCHAMTNVQVRPLRSDSCWRR